MKKIYKYSIIILSILFLLPFGCSKDFLDEKALTFYSEDEFYKTADGMDLAVVSLYTDVFNGLLNDNGRNAFYASWFLGTDVAEPTPMSYDAAFYIPAAYNTDWNSEHNYVLLIYQTCYKSINPINVILSNIDKPAWKTDAQKNRIKGNALFFRAWWYFYLVQAYGDTPLLTEPVKEAKTDFIRTPKSEVINQIVKDLTESVNILPELGKRNGEIGKGAALNLLSLVYLYQNEWAKAEQAATQLITGGTYKLMSERFGINKNQPGTPWIDLFLDGNINQWEGNKETIWALQTADRYLTNGMGQYIRCQWLNNYTKVTGIVYSDENWQRGKAKYRPSTFYLNLFDPKDDRGSELAIRTQWIYNNAALIQSLKAKGTPLTQVINGKTVEVKVGDVVAINSGNKDWLWPVCVKFMDAFVGRPVSEDFTDKDVPMMRLAGTYLYRAEARFRQGNLSGAADDINSIRRRAHAPEITSSVVNIDFILDEYARELMGEENRRFTLVRTGKLIERNKLYNALAKDNILEKHKLYPIPQVEIDRMKDSPSFKQNPGW